MDQKKLCFEFPAQLLNSVYGLQCCISLEHNRLICLCFLSNICKHRRDFNSRTKYMANKKSKSKLGLCRLISSLQTVYSGFSCTSALGHDRSYLARIKQRFEYVCRYLDT
uniref:Uncharacterized protein n=1 Tax=Micrurus surinamensis TaxID=129470 RepID=A0A2D4P6V5_MICSU